MQYNSVIPTAEIISHQSDSRQHKGTQLTWMDTMASDVYMLIVTIATSTGLRYATLKTERRDATCPFYHDEKFL